MDKYRKWIDALKKFESSPTVKIVCPECNEGLLLIKDEQMKDLSKVDRYLICDRCGKWNVGTRSLAK